MLISLFLRKILLNKILLRIPKMTSNLHSLFQDIKKHLLEILAVFFSCCLVAISDRIKKWKTKKICEKKNDLPSKTTLKFFLLLFGCHWKWKTLWTTLKSGQIEPKSQWKDEKCIQGQESFQKWFVQGFRTKFSTV